VSDFFRPMVSALALCGRGPSLVAWATLIAVAAATRASLVAAAAAAGEAGRTHDFSNYIEMQLLIAFVPTLIAGALMFFLARALIAPQTGHAQPLYGRFLGLFVATRAIDRLIAGAGTAMIFLGMRTPFMTTYGSVMVGSLASIVTLPFLVRSLAAAAGASEPRLGGITGFVFDEGRSIYAWYAAVSLLFPLVMVYAFADILGPGTANDLPGNLVQSAIIGTGGLLRYLLAIVAARWAIPGEQRLAETFA